MLQQSCPSEARSAEADPASIARVIDGDNKRTVARSELAQETAEVGLFVWHTLEAESGL